MTKPKPGVYHNVPFAEYLQWDAFSQSGCKSALITGLHYKHAVDNPPKPNDDMKLGSLVDCLLLEPGLFVDNFAIQPGTYNKVVTKGRGKDKAEETFVKPWNLNSKTCKEIDANITASGKLRITEIQHTTARTMVQCIKKQRQAREWLDNGESQVSVVWEDPTTGVVCKGRFDLFIEGDCIIDLKTTRCADEGVFGRVMTQNNYHIQAAMYSDAAAIHFGMQYPFEFIVAETLEPYGVATYDLDADSMLAGRAKYKRVLSNYADWKSSGEFPGYSEFAEPIRINQWEITKEIGDMNHEFF